MISRRSPHTTREDVAREAGVSVAVVSYVVNDGPRPVAAATKNRVLAAMKATGYRPNGIAQALALGVSGAYGLIVPDISNPFFAALAHELEDAVSSRGRVLLLGDSAESKTREQELVKIFLRRQIDGILYVGVDSYPEVGAAVDAGVPVVMLDRVDTQGPVSSVAVDNIAGARAATHHLIEHGYTRIGMISGPPQLSTTVDRELGWTREMTEASLTINPAWRIAAPFSRRGGLAAGRSLFALNDIPEAVFSANEQQAIGLLTAASERGIKVPEDLAVVAFDGTDDSEFTVPALTTIAQPLRHIAQAAVELLTRPQGLGISHTVCDFALLVRGSCGPHAPATAGASV